MKNAILGLFALSAVTAHAASTTLLNVSYDATRELYQEINPRFVADWKARTGETVIIRQSHGGSSKQSRSIIDGLEADVATLGIASDIDALRERGHLVAEDWQERLADDSAPYTSIVVLLVRKGNPKDIKDWDDLIRPGISVITPNPKTSAGARWNFLAAYSHALKRNGNDDGKARAFVHQLYGNVRVLDTGARGSTITFAQRELGDVLIGWENEAYLALKEFGREKFDIVLPSTSILAQPPVAVVENFARKHGTEELAKAYLRYLYSPVAQEIIAKNHYRPVDPEVAARHKQAFPQLELSTIAEFGGWKAAQLKFFGEGGVFDQIYASRKR